MRSRYFRIGLAAGLILSTPAVLGQKMNRCPDGKGGWVFQQEKCGESAEEADRRIKEAARIQAEAQRKKEEEARRKEESIQKARERDKAYQEQMSQKAAEEKKAREAEAKLMKGTTKEQGVDDGSLPSQLAQAYPGGWKEAANADIAAALGKNKTPACAQYRYRQRQGGVPEFIVQCTTDKANWVTYFVWTKAETVRGPVRF